MPKIEICLKYFSDKNHQKQRLWKPRYLRWFHEIFHGFLVCFHSSILLLWVCIKFGMSVHIMLLLFFHRHPSGRRMFPGQPWYHPTAQQHHGFPRNAVGDFVTPFVLEKLFDYSCSVEIAGSYYGHVPCKFRKVCLGLKYLPQINYRGEMTCFGCSPRIISLIWVAC